MKKILKITSLFSVFVLFMILMTSCSGYSFYKDWHKAGADIDKDHIFEVITLEQAETKKKNGDVFALLFASSSNKESVNVVTSFQAQAEYLEAIDKTIYFVDSTKYTSTSLRNEVRTALGMQDVPTDGAPAVMTFKSKAVDVDTTNKNSTRTGKFIVNGEIQYSSLASYIFRELK